MESAAAAGAEAAFLKWERAFFPLSSFLRCRSCKDGVGGGGEGGEENYCVNILK